MKKKSVSEKNMEQMKREKEKKWAAINWYWLWIPSHMNSFRIGIKAFTQTAQR